MPSDTTFRRPRSRLGAALAAAGLAASIAVVAPTTPAHAAFPDSFNPFGMNGGFTVYAREDATLANTETEGSIAVGGTTTKPGSGQYTLVHVVAGTADYTLPTVDGDPTRLLTQSFDPGSGGITAITSAGTSDPNLQGDLKLVERDGPWEAASRADWLRLNLDASQPDLTPLIDATHQQYPADAVPPTGATGDDSIYTLDSAGGAVARYVEAAREASYEQAADCLAGVADPAVGAGHSVGIAEDAGDRVVLEPLSADRPNVVDYADIAGAALIQFSPGPEPGVINPLIIRVPAGTTEVLGARADPQGAYSPYMLWDLSGLEGDVAVTALQARIDGSIYAPESDITVTAEPLDGQVLGRNVTLAGGEVHSFMFAGTVSCSADDGTFRIRKALDGVDPAEVGDRSFAVNYTAVTPDGDELRGSFELPADGTWVPAGEQFPAGTTIDFEEIPPASVPGYEWTSVAFAPDPLIIDAGQSADVVVTNTAEALTGTFSIAKEVESTTSPAPAAPPGTVPVSWTAVDSGETVGSGVLDVPFDGTPISPGVDFPLGTVITFAEDLSAVTAPDGYRWTSASWDPGDTVRIGGTDTTAVVLTNVLTPVESARTVTIVKNAPGQAVDPRYQYSVSYNIDPPASGGEARRTREIALGDPVTLDDLETGTDTLRLAELVPLFDSAPVDVSSWDAPVFAVTADGVTERYVAAGFEGQVPLAEAVVEIPLPASGDVLIRIRNALREGSFAVQKRLEGIDLDDVPPGMLFTVSWTATTPTGDVTTGTLRVPADGSPTAPVDGAGAPVTFPFGTRVDLAEAAPPSGRAIRWTDTSFEPDSLTIGADGAESVLATMTNAAAVETGTFLVAKDLAGIDPSEVQVDFFTVGFLAFVPGEPFQWGSIRVPADGTSAGPVTAEGTPWTFPLGTRVLLGEAAPPDDALPENYEWAQPTWSPSRTAMISRPDEPTTLVVTNSAVEHARVSLTKTVTGSPELAPAGTSFEVEWWLDSVPQPELTLVAGETVSSDHFPVGSIIEAREVAPVDVPGANWADPVWTLDGQVLAPAPDGRVHVPVSSGQETLAFTLENALNATPPPQEPPDGDPEAPGGSDDGGLAVTGATIGALPALGVVLALLGFALMVRRRPV